MAIIKIKKEQNKYQKFKVLKDDMKFINKKTIDGKKVRYEFIWKTKFIIDINYKNKIFQFIFRKLY